jgi:hypothetical protein
MPVNGRWDLIRRKKGWLSCPWVRQLSWYVPGDAGLLCDEVAVLRNMIKGTHCNLSWPMQVASSAFRRVCKIAYIRLLALSCLPVCPHGTTQPPLDGFSWNLIMSFMVEPCIFEIIWLFITDCPPLPTRDILYIARCAATSQPTNGLILLIFYKCSFSKERSVLPEDGRITETCRSWLIFYCFIHFKLNKINIKCICW